MQNESDAQASYMLATGEKTVSRLELLDRIFAPTTRQLLSAAGLCPGMRVVEIGCGIGFTSIWIAAQVGAAGAVVAVDSSSEQLQVAARSATVAGHTNISFREANAYETGLAPRSFDLVYSRFLLCHLADPARALAEMRSLLTTDGMLVCEDHDNGGIFTEPPTPAYRRLVEISDAVNRTRGLDSWVGLKLPGMFRAVGFRRPDVRVNQIAFLRGQEKMFWEITLREAEPSIVATGVSTPAELESVCDEMRTIAEDDSILLMLARVTQVWARR